MVRVALLVLFTVVCFLLAVVVMNGGFPGAAPAASSSPEKNGAKGTTGHNHSELPGECSSCPLPSN